MARQVVLDLGDEVAEVMFDAAARCAPQVELLIGVGQFPVNRFARSEIRFAHEAEFAEERKRSVDRREIDRWIGSPHGFGDLLRGHVRIAARNHIPHRQTRTGETMTGLPEGGLQLDCITAHGRIVRHGKLVRLPYCD